VQISGLKHLIVKWGLRPHQNTFTLSSMAESDILIFIGAHLPYVLLAVGGLAFGFIGLCVAFYYRGAALSATRDALTKAQDDADIAKTRLDDSLAALHTQAAKAEELERLRPLYQDALADVSDLRAQGAALEARSTAREEALEKELRNLEVLRKEMKEQFDAAANEALHSNRKAFLDLANETFTKHKQVAQADLEARQQSIMQLLAPVKDTLKRYEAGLSDVEKARREAYGALSAELKQVAAGQTQVQKEAAKLAQAMRASPKARGRWGEHQLQNIMELSGMAEYVDFSTQVHVESAGKRQQPDATIHLPGDRTIVVDAKASMSAYLDAIDAVSDEEREVFLTAHARQVREHIKQLSAKRYWEALEHAPDFVVMFLPNENLFSAALDKDPELLDFGLKNKVLIATPTTFMGFAKAVAYGWRQEKMAQNAKIIAELGQELYRRMAALGEKVAATGKHLDKAVVAYNGMIGSLEQSVMPQARKFRDLEVEGTGESLPVLPPIESDPRELAEGRDLKLETPRKPIAERPSTLFGEESQPGIQ
jgi:DNA recombination protein RmuC